MTPTNPSASSPPMSFALPMSVVSAPPLLPPWRADAKREAAGPSPCQALTAPALQQLLDKVAESLAQADQDVAQNGAKGVSTNPALTNHSALLDAQQKLLALQTYLKNGGFFNAGFVNNQTAAWNILNYIHYAVNELHLAQHHATLSVAYNTSRFALDSYNLTAAAIAREEVDKWCVMVWEF